ncbi:hypothetical protein [Pseudomonas mosselii]|uniref:Uncharacterized protein n=1 Tax=Pseudomonas mosselii TaxID=78327 RepID=A0AA42S094_9PSED|nr:hypothetical protein [Pseudomonas mosselii]MDH1632462.1 hypothetical protein [Pseudomonas mosselii]
MLAINPDLEPGQIKALLRRSALPLAPGEGATGEVTRPLAVEELQRVADRRVGQYARLDMRRALQLTIESLSDQALAGATSAH